MSALARKVLSMLVLGKVLRDYRAQVSSVLLISNPVSNLIRQILQLVAKDLQYVNRFAQKLVTNLDSA